MDRKKIGLLTPSSNTIMEPRTTEILNDLPDVSAHFARFRVTEISLGEGAMNQFKFTPQLEAAGQLADALVDVISWGGTSGGWVGVDNDRELCRNITEQTGIPASTSTLALLAAFKALKVRTFALVTPYLDEIQRPIIRNFAGEGYECVAERHLEDKGNYSFSEYGEEQIADMVREVAEAKPDAIAIYCTNFNGTRIAPALEQDLGIPVLDSVAFTLWHAMLLAGADTSRLKEHGRLFSLGLPD